jgi:hypothetical protein
MPRFKFFKQFSFWWRGLNPGSVPARQAFYHLSYAPALFKNLFISLLGIELRALCLLGRCSTTWAIPPAPPPAILFLRQTLNHYLCQGWLGTVYPPASTSWVNGIRGVHHHTWLFKQFWCYHVWLSHFISEVLGRRNRGFVLLFFFFVILLPVSLFCLVSFPTLHSLPYGVGSGWLMLWTGPSWGVPPVSISRPSTGAWRSSRICICGKGAFWHTWGPRNAL